MLRRAALPLSGPVLDVGAVYAEQLDFVYQSLHRLGGRGEQLSDLTQEVFVVVHRRRADHDASRPIRPWLFGICVGVIQNARRSARRKPTSPFDELEGPAGGHAPDEAAAARQRLRRAQAALHAMDPERRAVFVMYEVEGMRGEQIADALGIAPGTVHSRLFAARREIQRALEES
jgi:RNA polymerase sigma-70 factor (ECF subfamily)